MPSRKRVEQLIQMVERGEFVEALREFYAEDASTRENGEEPSKGLATLIEKERMALAAFRIRTLPTAAFLVDGDRAVIHWTFEFTDARGRKMRFEELASQLWRRERIVEERFHYDPAQRGRWT